MNIKGLFYRGKINIAKFLMLCCIFLFVFLFSSIKVNALSFDILSSTYTGNGKNNAAVEISFDTVVGENTITENVKYVQGSGISNQDGITFEMKDIYANIDDITSIAFWESAFSYSSPNKDYDRWYVRYVVCDNFDDTDGVACSSAWAGAKSDEYTVTYLDESKSGPVYSDIVVNAEFRRYYIERSHSNVMSGSGKFVSTIANFDKFFTDADLTYTYRIRNSNYKNREDKDGFGYKELEINLWRANEGQGNDINYATENLKFGLVKAISDVEAYTNYGTDHSNTKPINCSSADNKEKICIDYVDTNGEPTASTTVPKTTNVYLPDNILYSHKATTRAQVETDYMKTVVGADGSESVIDLDKVASDNTLYALNYFCEGTSITIANISYDANKKHSAACGDASTKLRKYLYVEAKLVGNDNIVNQDKNFNLKLLLYV